MKLFLLALLFPVLLFGGVSVTEAQTTTTTSSGIVTNKNPATDSQVKKNTSDITKTDFKNFTYPIPNIGKLERTFTLINGVSGVKNGLPNFTLRKTYFFDLTGDRAAEAITHIIADGCQMGCESSSLFYIHTTENDQPKLIWKLAIGGDVMGGLKAANFKVGELTIETFGDCALDDWLIKTKVDLKLNPKLKTSSYSRFQFIYDKGLFASGMRTVLPLEVMLNPTSFRPQITFGETQ